MKVLVVDDNPDIVESTMVALDMLDVESVACEGASQVLAAIRQERPDVVLHDLSMPGLDMEEQLRRLRAEPDIGATPVVLFTANRSRAEALDSLVQGVVQKPFGIDELMDQLEMAARGG